MRRDAAFMASVSSSIRTSAQAIIDSSRTSVGDAGGDRRRGPTRTCGISPHRKCDGCGSAVLRTRQVPRRPRRATWP
jgi:hypothetical protein